MSATNSKPAKPTGRLSVRAHVTDKKPNQALLVKDRLPTELDGVPVDVIELNPRLELVNRGKHIDPLIGGLAIGNTQRRSERSGQLCWIKARCNHWLCRTITS